MRKIFTIIATAVMAFTASAQDTTETWAAGDEYNETDNTITLPSISAQFLDNTSKGSNAGVGTWNFSNKGYVTGNQNGLEIKFTPSKNGTLQIYFAAAVASNKSVNMFVNGDTENKMDANYDGKTVVSGVNLGDQGFDEIAKEAFISYEIKKGNTYNFYAGGTKWRLQKFSFTPSADQSTEPTPEPTPGALMSWDFTKWSDATVANLKAGANWSDIEKADASEPTEKSKDNCFWQVSYEAGKTAEGYLTANDVVIEELKGLVYTNEKSNRSLAIAVNYPDPNPNSDFGPYHGPAYLWLGSKEINYFVIPNVPAGATIKMGVESHKITDARGVKLTVGTDELVAPNGEPVAAPTVYAEQEWIVPATAAALNDVQITNTNGCHIYFITVTDSSTSAIQTIVTDENAPVEYFNLQGIRVENPANGIFIKRQGNKVSKVRK